MIKRITAAALAAVMTAAMAVCILPPAALAANGSPDSVMMLGTGCLTTGDILFFGRDEGDRRQWVVTGAAPSSLSLISRFIYESRRYNEEYLVSQLPSLTYPEDDLHTSFLPALKNNQNYFTAIEASIMSELWLSGNVGASLRNGGAEYPYWIPGTFTQGMTTFPGNTLLTWCAPYVDIDGVVRTSFVGESLGILPCFDMNTARVLFCSTVNDGKKSGAVGSGALLAMPRKTDIPSWKLTVLDQTRAAFNVNPIYVTADSAVVSYYGAKTGANEYISAMVVDGGEITHYGRILQLDAAANATSGTISIDIPSGVSLGGDATLYVFNEQVNSVRETDYSSRLRSVLPTVTLNLPGGVSGGFAVTAADALGNDISASMRSIDFADGAGTVFLPEGTLVSCVTDATGDTRYINATDAPFLVDAGVNSFAFTQANGTKYDVSTYSGGPAFFPASGAQADEIVVICGGHGHWAVTYTGEGLALSGTINTTHISERGLSYFKMRAGNTLISPDGIVAAQPVSILVYPAENGVITSSHSSAYTGNRVTLSINPDAGYGLSGGTPVVQQVLINGATVPVSVTEVVPGLSYSFITPISGADVAVNGIFTNSSGGGRLAAPLTPGWGGANGMTAGWGGVYMAQGYSVQLFKDGTAESNAVGAPYAVGVDARCDLAEALTDNGAGTYYFKVRAERSEPDDPLAASDYVVSEGLTIEESGIPETGDGARPFVYGALILLASGAAALCIGRGAKKRGARS